MKIETLTGRFILLPEITTSQVELVTILVSAGAG
jgi:hypothetical protein